MNNFFSELLYISEMDYENYIRKEGKQIKKDDIVMVWQDGWYYFVSSANIGDIGTNKCDTLRNIQIVFCRQSKIKIPYLDRDYFETGTFLIYA